MPTPLPASRASMMTMNAPPSRSALTTSASAAIGWASAGSFLPTSDRTRKPAFTAFWMASARVRRSISIVPSETSIALKPSSRARSR